MTTANAPAAEVEAVIWDVGGVLLDHESVRAGHAAFVGWLAETYDLDSVNGALSTWRGAVGDYFRERDGTEFRPAREAYDRGVAAAVGEPIPPTDWRPRFREALAAHLRPNPGAREVLERIARTDRHQGILSDADAEECRFTLERLGLSEFVDAVTTSEDVGRTKPDPAMFEAALGHADVEPRRAVMVGDRYEHDMAGAARLGLRTVSYGSEDGPAVDHRIDDLREVLDLLGVER